GAWHGPRRRTLHGFTCYDGPPFQLHQASGSLAAAPHPTPAGLQPIDLPPQRRDVALGPSQHRVRRSSSLLEHAARLLSRPRDAGLRLCTLLRRGSAIEASLVEPLASAPFAPRGAAAGPPHAAVPAAA